MRYTILSYLWMIALIAYVQRAAISVPLLEIGHDLGLPDDTSGVRALGLLQSTWHLGYALCQLPAGRLADRIGSRRAIVLLAILWSLATALTGFARTYSEALIVWGLMGALQAGVFPCAVRSIGQVFGETERARASGWLGAGMGAGGAIAPVFAAWLLEWLAPWATAQGIDRWRICLVLYCLPGLAWAVVYWAGTGSASLDSNLVVQAPIDHSSGPDPFINEAPIWWRACGDLSLILLCSQQFLRAAAMIFFVTWFPTFLRETRGVSLMESGLLTTYAGIAAMIGGICGGYCSDWLLVRTGSKRIARQGLATVGMSICSVMILLSYFATDTNIAIGLMSFGLFVACIGGVAGYTLAIDYGGSRVGTVFGAMNMTGGFGAMLFPVTVGWLVTVTKTWNSALLVFAGLMAIDAIIWSVLNPKGQFLDSD